LRDVETLTKIADIQEQVAGLPKTLFHEQIRCFLFDGDVKCRLSKQGKDKIRRIYLFDELLIICRKQHNSKGAKTQKYQTHYSLNSAMIDTTECTTKIILSHAFVILTHENSAIQHQWQSYLEQAKK